VPGLRSTQRGEMVGRYLTRAASRLKSQNPFEEEGSKKGGQREQPERVTELRRVLTCVKKKRTVVPFSGSKTNVWETGVEGTAWMRSSMMASSSPRIPSAGSTRASGINVGGKIHMQREKKGEKTVNGSAQVTTVFSSRRRERSSKVG